MQLYRRRPARPILLTARGGRGPKSSRRLLSRSAGRRIGRTACVHDCSLCQYGQHVKGEGTVPAHACISCTAHSAAARSCRRVKEVEENKLPRPPPPPVFVQIVPRGSSHTREPKRRCSLLAHCAIAVDMSVVLRVVCESAWCRRGQQASPSCGANVFRRHHR